MRIVCALWFVLLSGLIMAQNTTKTVGERLRISGGFATAGDSRRRFRHVAFGKSGDDAGSGEALGHLCQHHRSLPPGLRKLPNGQSGVRMYDLGIHLTLNSEWQAYRWAGLTTSPGFKPSRCAGIPPINHGRSFAEGKTGRRADRGARTSGAGAAGGHQALAPRYAYGDDR